MALAAAAVAFALFVCGGRARRHGRPVRRPGAGVVLLIALLVWAAVLLPWRWAAERLQPRDHQRGMYFALGAWAVTDVAVLLVWGT